MLFLANPKRKVVRGKRNESSYIPYIAERLSELTGIEIPEIAAATTENAQKLFKI